MYNSKEKNKVYNDLKNQEYGEADLRLLSKVLPGHPLVRKAKRDPRRYAHEVLYALLGKSSRDEIRTNRREYSQLNQNEDETISPPWGDSTDTAGSNPDNSGTDSESGTNAEDGTGTTVENNSSLPGDSNNEEKVLDTAIVAKLQEEIALKDQELEQAEEQIADIESEKEELQEELDAEREARQAMEAALVEEKKSPEAAPKKATRKPAAPKAATKKPAAPKSRKKMNTPTSTGETSQTETSS